MKKLILFITVLLLTMVMAMIVALPNTALSAPADHDVKYKITFHNISADEAVICYLFQIRHDSRDAIKAAAELKPGKSWSVSYPKGKYHIRWEKTQSVKLLKTHKAFILKKNMDFYYP